MSNQLYRKGKNVSKKEKIHCYLIYGYFGYIYGYTTVELLKHW